MTDSTDEDQLRKDRGIDENMAEPAGLRFHPESYVQVKNDAERREKLRTDELERMNALYKRIEKGMDEGMVDLESGTKMLLNVSSARLQLGGVAMYPGAF